MALATARMTPRRENRLLSLAVAAATQIWAGGMVSVLADGTGAVPAGTASSGRAAGVATQNVDNTDGADGDLNVTVERGCFRFANSAAADEITIADVGEVCYVVDDETVALTDDSGNRVVAGAIVDVDDQGVWVEVGPGAVGPQGIQGEPGV